MSTSAKITLGELTAAVAAAEAYAESARLAVKQAVSRERRLDRLLLDAEPAPADAGDLILLAVVVESPRSLLPEADDHACRLVDDGRLVVVMPTIEARHLGPERVVPDLVTADGHEMLGGAEHPPVRRVLGVGLGENLPVPQPLGPGE